MKRNYSVLEESQEILFKGNLWKVKDIAKEYQPIIYQKKNLRGYPPSFILYEVIEKGNLILINYFVTWRDEIHPVFIIHFLYKIFRILYYGSSYDIEFISLTIEKNSGDILKIEMESDSHNNPDTFFSDHIKLTLEKIDGEYYNLKINNKPVKNVELKKEDKRIKIEAITWNHVYGVFKENNENFLEFKNLPLVYLTDNLYKKYRIKLRSNPSI
jgi:hypothetical protein